MFSSHSHCFRVVHTKCFICTHLVLIVHIVYLSRAHSVFQSYSHWASLMHAGVSVVYTSCSSCTDTVFQSYYTLCFDHNTKCALVVPTFFCVFSRAHSSAHAVCFSLIFSLCFSHTYSLCFIRTHSEWLFCLKRRDVSEDYYCLCKLTGLIGL